jgi:DNA polymerase-3 subunit gamma/tau
VNNNINQKFLEFERNKVSEFLQKELCNKMLQFTISVSSSLQEVSVTDMPLSSREQYVKLVELYPLVKELKDRLRLELDY